MGLMAKAGRMRALGVGVAMAILVGCAAPDPYAAAASPKGEQLDIRNILAANPNKRACIDYQAATNSCSSIITATVQDDTVISREVGAVRIPNSTQTQRIEVVTRSSVRDGQACVRPGDVSVTGRDQMSELVLGATRDLINQFGGTVCGTYYRSGDGYIVSTLGSNGQPFPPGDVRFQFITGDAMVRAQ